MSNWTVSFVPIFTHLAAGVGMGGEAVKVIYLAPNHLDYNEHMRQPPISQL